MPKMYKATNARETMCKDLHMKMNMHKGPTKLVSPTLFSSGRHRRASEAGEPVRK